jgi:hypothetical protein
MSCAGGSAARAADATAVRLTFRKRRRLVAAAERPPGPAASNANVTKSEPSPPKPAADRGSGAGQAPRKPLSPAAERALAEAAMRRAERDRQTPEKPGEVNGPQGPDPVRYGDWEKKGIASDF